MGEFEQLFGGTPQPKPQTVTIDVTGQDAEALEQFCNALAMIASGAGMPPPESLWPGLTATQNVYWQLQSGAGLAASGHGWIARFLQLPQVGQRLLSLKGGGHELHLQMDAAGRVFAATWRGNAGAMIFSIDPGAGGADLHVHSPVEFTIPLPAAVPGWSTAPRKSAEPAAAPAAPAARAASQAAAAGAPPTTIKLPPKGQLLETAEAQGWYLTVRNGTLAGKKIVLSGTVRIGRGTHNDLALPDDAASRNHATIEVTGEGCTLTDAGSTNGTVVNGVRITQPVRLNNGDVIVCGLTELAVEGPPKPPEPAYQATRVIRVPVPPAAPAAPAPPPPSPAGFCTFCGRPLAGEPIFCYHCGRQLR